MSIKFKVTAGALLNTTIEADSKREAAQKLKDLRVNAVALAEEGDLTQI